MCLAQFLFVQKMLLRYFAPNWKCCQTWLLFEMVKVLRKLFLNETQPSFNWINYHYPHDQLQRPFFSTVFQLFCFKNRASRNHWFVVKVTSCQLINLWVQITPETFQQSCFTSLCFGSNNILLSLQVLFFEKIKFQNKQNSKKKKHLHGFRSDVMKMPTLILILQS